MTLLVDALSTEFKEKVIRSMVRNGKEYQYDGFRSHLHKIPCAQGSSQCILNRIYRNFMTSPTFFIPTRNKNTWMDSLH